MFKNNLHIDMIKIVFCLFIFLSYANQDCLASVITITGPDAPNNGDQYTATGGTPPYTWAISKGSITQGGVVTVSGQCGTAIVTVTDASGNTGTKDVRMPSGVWVLISNIPSQNPFYCTVDLYCQTQSCTLGQYCHDYYEGSPYPYSSTINGIIRIDIYAMSWYGYGCSYFPPCTDFIYVTDAGACISAGPPCNFPDTVYINHVRGRTETYEWRCPGEEQCVDGDGDGYYTYNSANCPQGNDCNDSDPNINPATIWYKDTDNDGYSNGTTLTQCERPSGYKLASELTSTSGDCNDNNPAVNPSAQEVCGDGIDNNCNGQTDEGCLKCEISITANPNAVWPKNAGSSQTTSIITVSLTNPAPPEGCTVNLSVEPVANSGGHSHSGTRPKGKITDSSGNVISSVNLSNAENSAVVKYTSSEVGGEERIIATVTGGDESEAKIKVRVPGLGSMGESDAWRLTGQTTNHPVNHYGTYTTIGNIGNMAADYYQQFDATLGINDMSLPDGGMFDICGTYNPTDTCLNAPNGGHSSHRKGTGVDIDRTAQSQNGWIRVDRIAIREICKDYGGHLVRESTIHCEFPQ